MNWARLAVLTFLCEGPIDGELGHTVEGQGVEGLAAFGAVVFLAAVFDSGSFGDLG